MLSKLKSLVTKGRAIAIGIAIVVVIVASQMDKIVDLDGEEEPPAPATEEVVEEKGEADAAEDKEAPKAEEAEEADAE